jgi:hypothetical protein
MTALALTHFFFHRTPALLQKLSDSVSTFLAGIDDARTLSHRFEKLSRLSDVELAQRGLKRADIAKTVLGSIRS